MPVSLANRGVRAVGLLVVMLALSACQVRSEVAIEVNRDGSGIVTVGVGLDDDALGVLPEPSRHILTDDLAAAGWDVSAPVSDPDGFTWLRTSKEFGTPEEAEKVLEQIGGDAGLFSAVHLDRTDHFTSTSYELSAVADLSGGLSVFSDPELTAALDGEALGESIEAIEDRYGAPIDELYEMTITVDLPASNIKEYHPKLSGEPLEIRQTSKITDPAPMLWLGAAGVALLVVLILVVVRIVRRRRSTETETETETETDPDAVS